MPRVARRKDANAINSPLRSPKSIPLNDDKNEKAARLQTRQALHEIHLNQIRAAASPNHRKPQYGQAAASGRYEKDVPSKSNEKDQDWISGVSSLAANKRVPILANFEEWMRMATDNKINATNSWNFALIDYFHDMSLLKEGDSVNFQRASCTLDGCVKIYTSRVDSVATETGKLLSGLASSGSKENKTEGSEGQNEDDEMGGDDDEGDGSLRRKNKKKVRSSEATLASSFAQVQLKKFELEFNVDPLFKKASADFDEGGAKGLLLNHLCMDSNGRIIFDSSDDMEDSLISSTEDSVHGLEGHRSRSMLELPPASTDDSDCDVELEGLQMKFLSEVHRIDEQEICPSLKELDIGETMDMASLSDLYSRKRKDDNVGPADFGGDDFGLVGLGNESLDLSLEAEFGNGGEVWASEAGLEPLTGAALNHGKLSLDEGKEHESDAIKEESSFGVKMQFGFKGTGHQDILGYFDSTTQANWAGPEHWKIRRMRQDATPRELPRRKEKELFEIDFRSSFSRKATEQIHASAPTNSAISLPKSRWRSRSRHLLPDDKHFTSSQLLRLYLKPKAQLGRRMARNFSDDVDSQQGPRFVNNSFWAKVQPDTDLTIREDYNADFFREDATVFPNEILDDDAEEFADAREDFSPPFEHQEQTSSLSMLGTGHHNDSEMGYGSTLITRPRRLRPEYVTYAKVAKRVDVRLLKEKIWNGLGFEALSAAAKSTNTMTDASSVCEKSQEQNFTTVLNSLQNMYSPEALSEISTSYCFISLLHLANEKGLQLSNDHGLEELSIRKDTSVVLPIAV